MGGAVGTSNPKNSREGRSKKQDHCMYPVDEKDGVIASERRYYCWESKAMGEKGKTRPECVGKKRKEHTAN